VYQVATQEYSKEADSCDLVLAFVLLLQRCERESLQQ
jgi:hypothetical protein